MSAIFEEIDRRDTPIGEISVRRRLEPTLQVDVYDVKLGDEFLMSSLFTVAEIALADLGLGTWPGTEPASLNVVVGGLGLGYTARAALADARVRSCAVVEALGAVIGWHTEHLLPLAEVITGDPRCRFVEGDFGLWADGAPDDAYLATLHEVFATATAHTVTFPNFYTGGESSSTVYVAITAQSVEIAEISCTLPTS